MVDLYLGSAPIKLDDAPPHGDFVVRDDESYYRIRHFDRMPPFLISLTSGGNHWMYLSSTGGLTCGRKSPENALFPYTTDDKVHDAYTTTGPQTVFRVKQGSRKFLWKPFSDQVPLYERERSLYKNLPGNRIVYEEINHDLGLVFSYEWSTCERYGFVRKASLRNLSGQEVELDLLDGIRNLLPYGVEPLAQSTLSTLIDGYKQAERVPQLPAAIFSLSSILSDRAEPSEALKATVVWGLGLEEPRILVSEDQVRGFCLGEEPSEETFKRGKRGAFYVNASVSIPSQEAVEWYLVADINQGAAQLTGLVEDLRQSIDPVSVDKEIERGQETLKKLVGKADGFQYSADPLISGRHFSNTLFNIMRGGVFQNSYAFSVSDFLQFISAWNLGLKDASHQLLAGQSTLVDRDSVIALAEQAGDPDLLRLSYEYLPLVFSRRHGDPSRPWNHFSIELRNEDGSSKLWYQGNWRDIFQNWEALAISYPEYIESFIAKFVNASTADGYNPYRISRDGIDWEVLEPDDPWSNIGYWGDHQVNYLVRLIEFSHQYHPGKLNDLFGREIFVYADVPYRLNDYAELKRDPRNSVEFDDDRALEIDRRVKQKGSDGKLVTLDDGSIHRVNLVEKLLVSALAKIGNLVPGGGIWMNTQRPEWNDANNALVGYGLSMVTLCFLRRFMALFAELLDRDTAREYRVSSEVEQFFSGIDGVLSAHAPRLSDDIEDADRKQLMDELGELSESYRRSIYSGFSGDRKSLDKSKLLSFIQTTLEYLDTSIRLNRRDDGLYHSYNLIQFGDHGYGVERLDQMLEGQVAVLSSGCLNASESLDLLKALRKSDMFRQDQGSYLLYPDKKLDGFLEKNRIPASDVDRIEWLKTELAKDTGEFVERDVLGGTHFNGRFRNSADLRAALVKFSDAEPQDIDRVCDLFEDVFSHRQFTGRSGSMYKYEGLGSIYWHMVSKLGLAAAEAIRNASDRGADDHLMSRLMVRFDEIREGLGLHKSPYEYGAFPMDPYSHTPGFAGVQQPGMTGQVKEDVIIRFSELGVLVRNGKVAFDPIMLKRKEFTRKEQTWNYSVGDAEVSEELDPGCLAFTLCGVPVVYRMSTSPAIRLHLKGGAFEDIDDASLGSNWSQSLFRRDGKIQKIEVDIKESKLV